MVPIARESIINGAAVERRFARDDDGREEREGERVPGGSSGRSLALAAVRPAAGKAVAFWRHARAGKAIQPGLSSRIEPREVGGLFAEPHLRTWRSGHENYNVVIVIVVIKSPTIPRNTGHTLMLRS